MDCHSSSLLTRTLSELAGSLRLRPDHLGAPIGFDWDTSRGKYTVTVFGRNLSDRVGNTAAVIVPGLLAFGAPREGRIWGVTLMTDF